MGETVEISLYVKAKPNTSKKVLKAVCKELRNVNISVPDFSDYKLYFDGKINFSYMGLDMVEHLNFPKNIRNKLEVAELTIKYIEHAPERTLDLREDQRTF